MLQYYYNYYKYIIKLIMGNAINKAREEAQKTSEQSEKLFNDAINMLYQIAS